MTDDLRLLVAALRRRWALILGAALVALVLSVIATQLRPPQYQSQVTVLVTRADTTTSNAGADPSGADRAAQDVPAIIAGEPFQRDAAALLTQQNTPIDAATIRGALTGEIAGRSVAVVARAATPEQAVGLAAAVPELLRTNGLRYWGDPQAEPSAPGLNVAVLQAPSTAQAYPGRNRIMLEIVLRTIAGTALGAGGALVLHALQRREDKR